MDVSQQQTSNNTQQPAQVTLAQAFWYWLKMDCIEVIVACAVTRLILKLSCEVKP